MKAYKGYRIVVNEEAREDMEDGLDLIREAIKKFNAVSNFAFGRDNTGDTCDAFDELVKKLYEIEKTASEYEYDAEDYEPSEDSVADPVNNDLAALAAKSLWWGAQ